MNVGRISYFTTLFPQVLKTLTFSGHDTIMAILKDTFGLYTELFIYKGKILNDLLPGLCSWCWNVQ